MAGSINHTIDEEGYFIGTKLLNNLGDAEEALEEYYLALKECQHLLFKAMYEERMYGFIGPNTVDRINHYKEIRDLKKGKIKDEYTRSN